MRLHPVCSLLSHLLAILTVITPITQARQSPTSYCKCICFTNSTIIPLNSPPTQQKPSERSIPAISLSRRDSALSNSEDLSFTSVFARSPDDSDQNNAAGDDGGNDGSDSDGGDGGDEGDKKTPHRELTCNDCNRAFCLDYNLPICKGAKEEDVFTSCFQRDSVKDETVVLIFILLTATLLLWALLKPWIDRARDSGTIAAYSPIGLRGGGRSANARGGVLPRTEYADDGGDEIGAHSGGRNRNSARDVSGSVARQGGLNS